MKKIILSLALVASLGACSSPVPNPVPLKVDFSENAPVMLRAQNFNVVDRTTALPTRAPYVTNMFQPKLPDVVAKWGRARITTTGAPGQAVMVIKDASVTVQALPLATGFNSWFTRQQSHKYTAKVEVDIEARTNDNMASAFATARAVRTTTLPEDPTDAEKTRAYNEMLNDLMHDLDSSMELAVRQHMGNFLVQ